MRLLIAFLILSSATVLTATEGLAQRQTGYSSGERIYPYCHRQPMSGSFNCGFVSFAQCMATASGDGGDCVENPRLSDGRRR